MRWLVGSWLLACISCTWDGRDSGVIYSCPDDRCPAGHVCRAGVCEAMGSGSGDGGITSSWCSETPRFIEEFETDLDPGRWGVTSQNGAVAHSVGGHLAIDYTAQTDSEAEATMVSNVDHERSEVTIEITSPPDTSSSYIQMRMVDTPGTEPITFVANTYDLSASIDSDFDVPQELRTAPFEPQKHKFWRITRLSDQICFYTSRDGMIFEEFVCGPSDGVRSSLRVALSAGNYAGDGQTVGFDHLAWCVRNP
jgi:hypothetical protein